MKSVRGMHGAHPLRQRLSAGWGDGGSCSMNSLRSTSALRSVLSVKFFGNAQILHHSVLHLPETFRKFARTSYCVCGTSLQHCFVPLILCS